MVWAKGLLQRLGRISVTGDREVRHHARACAADSMRRRFGRRAHTEGTPPGKRFKSDATLDLGTEVLSNCLTGHMALPVPPPGPYGKTACDPMRRRLATRTI
jgi:hypothetical protein